jgi:hypothetical protein
MVNNFTSYLLNSANLVNNALASNMRVYNTALEQTRDNLKDFTKTNTNFIQTVSGNSQNRDGTTSNYNNNNITKRQLGINFNLLVHNLEILNYCN